MDEAVQLIRKNFKSVEQALSSLLDNRAAGKLLYADITITDDEVRLMSGVFMEFERVIEIILNIFFRVIEFSETGSFSEQIKSCLDRMKNLSLITSVELWLEMIDMRANLGRAMLLDEKKYMCGTILTVYAGEYRFLCAEVRKRYGSD